MACDPSATRIRRNVLIGHDAIKEPKKRVDYSCRSWLYSLLCGFYFESGSGSIIPNAIKESKNRIVNYLHLFYYIRIAVIVKCQ